MKQWCRREWSRVIKRILFYERELIGFDFLNYDTQKKSFTVFPLGSWVNKNTKLEQKHRSHVHVSLF